MFGIGMPELILILAVALIVIGPKKLPDLAKSLGRALGEFKRATNDLKESIQSETGLDEVRNSFNEMDSELKASLKETDPLPATAPDETMADMADTDSPLSKVRQAMDDLNRPHAQPPEGDETPPASPSGDGQPSQDKDGS